MLFQPTLFLASVASLAAAAVLPDVSPAERASLSPRLAELCGQWDNEAQASGRYLLYNNRQFLFLLIVLRNIGLTS